MTAFFARWGAVRCTLVGACLLLMALEVWRPCFFLTDDNMSYWLPILVGLARRVGSEKTLWIEPHLFGGRFNILHDPNLLSLCNPLTFLTAPLARSRFFFWLPDVFVALHLLVSATGMAALLSRLARWQRWELSLGRIVFLSLSFTFSQYALTVGASWEFYIADQAALPLLALGILHPNHARGLAWGTLGCLYALGFGHPGPFLFALLFFGIFALCWCRATHSFEPVLRLAGAAVIAGVLASPILWGMVHGFSGSTRSAALSLEEASRQSVDPVTLGTSFFAGFYGVAACVQAGLHVPDNVEAFASCAGAWSIFTTWGARKKAQTQPESQASRQALALQDVALGMVLVVALFVMRPLWLGTVLHALPLYRSLRWPFREIFILLFWVHLWIASRPVQVAPRWALAWNAFGVAVFLFASLRLAPWSFAPMPIDRHLLMSGQTQAFWNRLGTRFGPGDRLIVVADPSIPVSRLNDVPFSLLGAYNYPALIGVRSASGYTSPGLLNGEVEGHQPNHWSGTFSRADGEALLLKDPHLKALELVSLDPVRIDWRAGTRREPLTLPPLPARSLRR